ncbi:uncharacterized protein N7484_006718 [Penicillium longicatenatum]|uniref:uncharacterized protein n=1 Tax=Penicillium longicatenatum TaxID=1561947 RepID=UPI002547B836|nr:uncharacterized protein N7484_006718 [Penicillium longicatenatum]KAJ5644211.1 hypothetical protein N7484_006718 [Penicillium longicatenatum]
MLILAFSLPNQPDTKKDGQTTTGQKDDRKDDQNNDQKEDQKDGQVTDKKSYDVDDKPPPGPWGNRGVTSPKAGTKRPPQKDSSLNVRINLDLRADVALELHAVIQGDVTIGLF